MKEEKEIQRILSNPENVILSEGLADLIASDDALKAPEQTAIPLIEICDKTLRCEIVGLEVKGLSRIYIFTLKIPSFSIEYLLEEPLADNVKLIVGDKKFFYVGNKDILEWKDNLLKVEMRKRQNGKSTKF